MLHSVCKQIEHLPILIILFAASFELFYSFHTEEFKKRVKVITMKEFIEREGRQNGLVPLDDKDYKRVLELASQCQNRRKSE